MEELKARNINPLTLAYMGDAVYEIFVRRRVIESGRVPAGNADLMHKAGVHYVNAYAQADAVKTIYEGLSETEQALVKRARNHKTATKAKNADIVTYKWATAFEALLGYLYLSGQQERLDEILGEAARITEERKWKETRSE